MENPTMDLKIEIHPEKAGQGEKIMLRVVNPTPKDTEYQWELVGYKDQKGISYLNEGHTKVSIDTSHMPPNTYEIRVTARPKAGKEEPIIEEKYFQVTAPPISTEFVEKVAADFAKSLRATSTPAKEPAANVVNPPGGSFPGEPELPNRDELPPTSLRVRLVGQYPDYGDSENNLQFWQTIRNRTEAIKFGPYQDYINDILCGDEHSTWLDAHHALTVSEFHGVDAFNLLQKATEAFLIANTGVFIPGELTGRVPGEASRLGRPVSYREIRDRLSAYLGGNGLPYLDRIVRALGDRPGRGTSRGSTRDLNNFPDCTYVVNPDTPNTLIFDDGFRHPVIMELIWNYWHEEGMLVQTMNAITLRMQNRRGPGERDPLAHLELDPLRPLNNMLWGYLQEEHRRLTVQRRAYEYDHHYGLNLYGKAIPEMRTVDSRSKFLEAFHNLLILCTTFYKQSDDTTVNPDPFPLLNALKEVHLILAQGAHNQFGDMPWTARSEMLTQQWLLARPEMNEYLRGRPMVPYEEEWMGRVDTMKTLQGWGDTAVTYFHNLAVFGEQLLLSIRYTDWVGINLPGPAGVWALYWRAEIQGYIHAYRAATGVYLSVDGVANLPAEMRYMRPSELLRRRLIESRNGHNGKNGDKRLADLGERAAPQLADQSEEIAIPAHQTFRERKALRR